ncbi:MAG: hypothetical protein LBD14_01205 [Puniceicoccales bacterium]|jgi:hypothetical protein|nr:hypothetical protein [Puniceicoccales bacterium]
MKAVFGLGSEKFDELAMRMEIFHIEKLASRKGRERAIGAGSTELKYLANACTVSYSTTALLRKIV